MFGYTNPMQVPSISGLLLGCRSRTASPSAGQGQGEDEPGTGNAAIINIVNESPALSATRPSSGAPIPPSPIESPIVMPAASPMRPGRYSCPITTVMPNVPTVAAPTRTSIAIPKKGRRG